MSPPFNGESPGTWIGKGNWVVNPVSIGCVSRLAGYGKVVRAARPSDGSTSASRVKLSCTNRHKSSFLCGGELPEPRSFGPHFLEMPSVRESSPSLSHPAQHPSLFAGGCREESLPSVKATRAQRNSGFARYCNCYAHVATRARP